MSELTINPLVIKLFEALKKNKVSVPKFSKITGIPADRIYKWKQEGTTPKKDDEKVISEWIASPSLEISPKINDEHSEKIYTAEDVRNITESNRMMAEAMLIDARNREKLVDTNATLTTKVFTGGGSPKTPLDVSSKIAAILRVIADIGTQPGKKWKDRKQALEELYKLVPVPHVEDAETHIHEPSSKKRK